MRGVQATFLTAVVALGGCGPGGPSPTPPPVSPTMAGPTPTSRPSPSPSPSPSLSPLKAPTGVIAFVRDESTDTEIGVDLYAVDVAGGVATRLSNDKNIEGNIYWLLDGSRLVYWWDTWADPYHQTLTSIRPDGTGRQDLGRVQTSYSAPAYSPDRRSIVFSGDGDEEHGTGLILLDLVDGTRRQLTTHGETRAVWSPDGSKILAILPSRRVVVIDAATGTELSRIADPDVQDTYGWSQDGLSVIYHGCGNELDKDECSAATPVAANADGTNIRPYTDPVPQPPSGSEAMSPDGRWIATWANGRLEVAPSAGGQAVQLAALGGPATWSPDSAWLVFSGQATGPIPSGDPPKSWLFLVARDGGDPVPLTRVNDSGAAWQPR